MRRKNSIPFIALLLAGCIDPKGSLKQASAEMPPREQKQETTPIHCVEVTSFRDYNPPGSPVVIPLDACIEDLVLHGLDVRTNNNHDSLDIENIVALRERWRHEAEKLGYTRKQLETLSPKETLLLNCEITTRTFDYFGHHRDYLKTRARTLFFQNLDEAVLNIENDTEAPSTIKDSGIRTRKILEKLRQAYGFIYRLEGELERESSDLTAYLGFDKMPTERLFESAHTGIICRQFATVQRDLFAVAKTQNPLLQNTHVARYLDHGHCWNQVVTLSSRENNTTTYLITFFDPTCHDGTGDHEGYDSAHFGTNSYSLSNQISVFQDALAQQARENLAKK